LTDSQSSRPRSGGRRSDFWVLSVPTRQELRNFGLLFGALTLAVAALLWYRDNPRSWSVASAALVLLAVALLLPGVLRPPFTAWMLFARVLGFVNSHILLALIFYTVFTLVGFIMRMLRYDPLDRRLRRPGGGETGESYWSRREVTSLPANHFERQF